MLPPVAPWLLESMEYGEPRRFNELTLDQQRDVYRAVKILQHMASSEKKLLGEMRQREIDATVAELTESIDRLPERRFITDREKKYRFSLGNLLHVWRENHGTKLMQSYIFKAADGYISKGSEQAKGPNERLLQEPFSKAESQELLLQSKFTKLLEKALHPLAKDKDLLKPFAIPEVALPNDVTLAWGKGRSWDMEKVFCVALNMGNEGNLNALRKGYGWTDADLAAITGRLTPEQWQAVQAVWDTIDKLYPRLNDVYETLNGVPLPKVERVPLNVTAADGSTVTLGGGYYPLVFDRRFKDKAGMLEDVDDALNFTEAMLRTPKPKSGMTKTRTGGTLPPKLSADVVMRHVTDTIHYVTHELPLRNVYQIVRDQKYAESFTRAFGKESYETLLPWLRGIARPEKIHKSAGDNTVEFLCKMGTLNVMGFSFTTAMMGFTSLTNSMHRVGTLPFLRAVGDFAKHPVENWRTVTALSPYMANRATMMDRDIGSALKEWRGTDNMLYIGPLRLSRQRFGQAAYALISAVDSVVAMPTWMGAYKKAVAAGKAMEEAVQAGDDAVLEAQAGGGRSSMSALMRDPGMWRLLTVFMTFSNNMYNRQAYYLSGLIARAKGGKAASAITLKDATMAFAMELFIPALSAVLLMGLLREGEAPEEKDYLMEILSGMTQGYIWMRAAVSYLKSGFEPGSPVAFSWIKPAAQVISTLAEAVKENRSLTKKESAQTLRRIIKVGGFFTGVPTVQAFRTVDGIEAFNKGKGGPLTPLLGKPTEKKK